MPYKSKRQQRFFFAAEARGDLPEGTAKRWAQHTKSIKALPEKVDDQPSKEASVDIIAQMARQSVDNEYAIKAATDFGVQPNLIIHTALIRGVSVPVLVKAGYDNPPLFAQLLKEAARMSNKGDVNKRLEDEYALGSDLPTRSSSRRSGKAPLTPGGARVGTAPAVAAPPPAATPPPDELLASGGGGMSSPAGLKDVGPSAPLRVRGGKHSLGGVSPADLRASPAVISPTPGASAGASPGAPAGKMGKGALLKLLLGLGAGATGIGAGGMMLMGGKGSSPDALPSEPPVAPAPDAEAGAESGGNPRARLAALLGAGALGLGGYGAYKMFNRKKPKEVVAADLFGKEARDRAGLVMNHFLDKVAGRLPLTKQASVRVIQTSLASGDSLSTAIKMAHPTLAPEARGVLAAKLVKAAASDFAAGFKRKSTTKSKTVPVAQSREAMQECDK